MELIPLQTHWFFPRWFIVLTHWTGGSPVSWVGTQAQLMLSWCVQWNVGASANPHGKPGRKPRSSHLDWDRLELCLWQREQVQAAHVLPNRRAGWNATAWSFPDKKGLWQSTWFFREKKKKKLFPRSECFMQKYIFLFLYATRINPYTLLKLNITLRIYFNKNQSMYGKCFTKKKKIKIKTLLILF